MGDKATNFIFTILLAVIGVVLLVGGGIIGAIMERTLIRGGYRPEYSDVCLRCEAERIAEDYIKARNVVEDKGNCAGLRVVEANWFEIDGELVIVADYVIISDELVPGTYSLDGDHVTPHTSETAPYYYIWHNVRFHPTKDEIEWYNDFVK